MHGMDGILLEAMSYIFIEHINMPFLPLKLDLQLKFDDMLTLYAFIKLINTHYRLVLFPPLFDPSTELLLGLVSESGGSFRFSVDLMSFLFISIYE